MCPQTIKWLWFFFTGSARFKKNTQFTTALYYQCSGASFARKIISRCNGPGLSTVYSWWTMQCTTKLWRSHHIPMNIPSNWHCRVRCNSNIIIYCHMFSAFCPAPPNAATLSYFTFPIPNPKFAESYYFTDRACIVEKKDIVFALLYIHMKNSGILKS